MLHRALGYSGHKTAKESIPPSLKPGDTVHSLAYKYAALADNYPNNQEPTKLNFVSMQKMTFNNVQQNSYHVPDKRGISVKFLESAPPSKPFVAKTMFHSEIRRTGDDVKLMQQLKAEGLKAAFDALADEEGTIDSRQVKKVLAVAFNAPMAPRWLVDKFTGYYGKYGVRPDGRTDWAEFCRAKQAVLRCAQGEAASKPVGFPQWIAEARKVPHRVVTTMDAKSAYQYEIDAPGNKPLNRPYTYKATMASTTLDVQTGTTKHTYNPPGYGGTVPDSLRHAVHRLHAEKRLPHRPRSDLLLTYHCNIPGYSGHTPIYALRSVRPRDFGKCALTSQGAASLGLML